jgi:hypothetical protein
MSTGMRHRAPIMRQRHAGKTIREGRHSGTCSVFAHPVVATGQVKASQIQVGSAGRRHPALRTQAAN